MAKIYLKMTDNELNSCADKKGRRCHLSSRTYKECKIFLKKHGFENCDCLIFIQVPEPEEK